MQSVVTGATGFVGTAFGALGDRTAGRLVRRDLAAILHSRRQRSRTLAAIIAAALGIAALPPQPSAAAELEGVHFADQVRVGDATLRLHCLGLLRYKLLIKAYVAALYVGDGEGTADVLADVPKRLELSYFWNISGADFGKAGDQILAQNVDAQTMAALRPRLDRINAWYRDVKPGDRYSLTYVPGNGTELALNSKRLGVVEGADFAAAYFRIWLGETAIDTRLRDQLLRCEQRDSENKQAAYRPLGSIG